MGSSISTKNDLVEAKKQASVVEARGALYRMQNQLDDGSAGDSLLGLARPIGSEGGRPAQPVQRDRDGRQQLCRVACNPTACPMSFREALAADVEGVYVTCAGALYRRHGRGGSGRRRTSVRAVGTGVSVYFIFPASTEQQTLHMLQRDLVSTGVLLMICLGVINCVIAREITKPLRTTGEVAGHMRRRRSRPADGDQGHRRTGQPGDLDEQYGR